jgi:hypothetical protein
VGECEPLPYSRRARVDDDVRRVSTEKHDGIRAYIGRKGDVLNLSVDVRERAHVNGHDEVKLFDEAAREPPHPC